MEVIGRTVSHYKIMEELGRGGMPSIIKTYNSLVPRGKGDNGSDRTNSITLQNNGRTRPRRDAFNIQKIR